MDKALGGLYQDAELELKEKLVYYKDKKDRLRRFDTDKGKNKKYQ